MIGEQSLESLPLPSSLPRSAVLEFLRAELAPTPGRWRESLYVALGTTTALVVSQSLQVPLFVAAVIAYTALQPNAVCTWRNMCTRVLLTAFAALCLIPLAGVLIQLPWLLLPCFFVAISAVTYVSPLTNRPLEGLAVLYVTVTALYTGIFDPHGMPNAVGYMVYGYSIGIVTATVFAQLRASEQPSAQLAAALASGFARARAHLDEVTARYVAEQFNAPAAEAPLSSQFGRDQQLLERVRQEGLSHEDVAFLGTLVIVVERVLTDLDTIDSLSRQPVGRTYRRMIAPEVSAAVAAIASGLGAYADSVRGFRPGTVNAASDRGQWPDYHALIAAVEARQVALKSSGAFKDVDVAEGANTNAFVQALVAVADILHTTPAELRNITGDDAPAGASVTHAVFHPNRYAARYAMQVGLGTTISYLIGIIAHAPVLLTMLWNPLFIAQSSYGATIRRSGARFGGVVLGCLLALLASITVMPNVSQLPALAILMLAITLPCQYIALGPSSYSYVGFQAAFSFAVVSVAAQPMTDIHGALWRVYGGVLGTSALFLVFRFVAPDYAGRQLIARFADVLRGALAYVPPLGAAPPTLAQALAVRREIGTAVPDIVRLADEARSEGGTSGIDTAEAIHAAGRAIRVAYRLGIVCRNRFAARWPALSEPMRRAVVDVEGAVRARLEINLRILEARNTMARPGSRAHQAACVAAAAEAARPRPDVVGPLDALRAHLDAVRLTELTQWPPDATGALFAEVEHLRRIGELMPQLDQYLLRMCLPEQIAERPTAD